MAGITRFVAIPWGMSRLKMHNASPLSAAFFS
jgi:hypothetical protein